MTNKGTLIAIAEGRDKATNQAGNDLLVARSKDQGKTWSKPTIAYEQGDDSCNNPCLVQDAKSGRVFLFFQTFPAGGRVRTPCRRQRQPPDHDAPPPLVRNHAKT